MSWTTNLFLRLSPLVLPYLVLFCGGVSLTICQSVVVLTPLPHAGGALNAYARILVDRSFFASFAFSLAESMVGVVIVLAMFSYPYMFRALVAGFQTWGRIIGYAPETWVPEALRSCCGWNCPCSYRR